MDNHVNSSENLLSNANRGDRLELLELRLQIDNEAAQKSSMRPPKTPHGCYGDFALERQANRFKVLFSFGKHCTRVFLRFWDYGWTAETCSFVFSLLIFAGLVVMLLVHQNRPVPEWPQIISINSIVSLFSLFMRTGVGLVLAEGASKRTQDLILALPY